MAFIKSSVINQQTSVGRDPDQLLEQTVLDCAGQKQKAGNLASKAVVWFRRALKSDPKAKSFKT